MRRQLICRSGIFSGVAYRGLSADRRAAARFELLKVVFTERGVKVSRERNLADPFSFDVSALAGLKLE